MTSKTERLGSIWRISRRSAYQPLPRATRSKVQISKPFRRSCDIPDQFDKGLHLLLVGIEFRSDQVHSRHLFQIERLSNFPYQDARAAVAIPKAF